MSRIFFLSERFSILRSSNFEGGALLCNGPGTGCSCELQGLKSGVMLGLEGDRAVESFGEGDSVTLGKAFDLEGGPASKASISPCILSRKVCADLSFKVNLPEGSPSE